MAVDTLPLAWTLRRAAVACRGLLVGPGVAGVGAIVTDSRAARPGTLFVAIVGERFDGHGFARRALDAGAAGVVVVSGKGDGLEPRIEVPDTLAALTHLAEARRSELAIPVLAITGSTGKTSTKDLAAAALAGSWASPQSYNNEVGVPLTVLSTPPEAAYLVVEVGSRGTGHIASLGRAVRPDVAVITNLGVVHLEGFGTKEALAAAKWELVEQLTPAGAAVLPHGGSFPATRSRVVTFGEDAGADVRIDSLRLDQSGRPTFRLVHGSERVEVSLFMAGVHQARNAAAAAAAAHVLGVSLEEAATRMEQAVGSRWRMEIHRGTWTVVNDSYNANPDSMEAALRTVAAMPGRHVAVLGVMAELGTVSVQEHHRIGRLAVSLGFDPIIVVGPEPGIAAAAGSKALRVGNNEEAVSAARSSLEPGDVVLVKGSRVAGLEAVAAALTGEESS